MSENNFQLGLILLGYASLQGFILTIIFFAQKKGNKTSNYIIGFLVFIISLLSIQFVLILTGYYQVNYWVTFPISSLRYTLGPLLFWYVLSLSQKDYQWKWVETLHFIPFLIFASLAISLFFIHGAGQNANNISRILEAQVFELTETSYLLMVLNKLHPLIYALICFRILKTASWKNTLPNGTREVTIIWLKRLCFFFFLSQLISIGVTIFFYFESYYTYYLDILVVFLISIVIHFIGINSMVNPDHLFPRMPKSLKRLFARSNSSEQDLKEKLINYVESEKPYLNPDLKLADLAEALDVSTHAISNTLNNSIQLNFYDFINQYRVDEMKLRLSDPKYQFNSLLGNALEVGFNSKSSFNRIFKKHTGETPSAFYKAQSKQ